MSAAVAEAKRLTDRPAVAHLMRAGQRFSTRLGSQFGAAITYFSVLAVVPILLFAFSVVGFVLTELDPGALAFVLDQARSILAPFGPKATAKMLPFIEDALRHWAAPGIVGLISAMYSGAGWTGNLRNAVDAQFVQNFDAQFRKKQNIIVKTAKNFGVLVGLLVSVVVTFAIVSVSTSLTGLILDALGLSEVGWLKPVLHLLPILFSIGAGWLVFMYLFLVLPDRRAPWPALRRGALIGAVGLAVLQYAAALVLKLLGNNKAIALFGPVVLVMLFLNLFAQLILFCAAWVGTWEKSTPDAGGGEPAEPADSNDRADDGSEGQSDAQSDAGQRPRPIRTPGRPVPEAVALRASKLSLGTGYAAGAATGAGVGALLAVVLAKITGRRRRD